MKIIYLIGLVFLFTSFIGEKYHYYTKSVSFYMKEGDGEWEFNNKVEQEDFFVFNTDFSKLELTSDGGKSSMLLKFVEKDKYSIVWEATHPTGQTYIIILKEDKYEVRMVVSMGEGTMVMLVYHIEKAWITNIYK